MNAPTNGAWKAKGKYIYSEGEVIGIAVNRYNANQVEKRLEGESYSQMVERTKGEREKATQEELTNAKIMAAGKKLYEVAKRLQKEVDDEFIEGQTLHDISSIIKSIEE